ncbi:hypothetical protein FSP39_024876 [Pinctada imbricata]|uniref:TIR domain-containing protein n=1 Tax=Pinctada imbricata TaxID=66713 RepID=A0AA88Y0N4_PINIB|nr:hypothetical protein FSP39_024876 [Pinctada imbricata]
MKKLPNNLCEFPSIVKIDLTDNAITDLDGISCVLKLDTLIVRRNSIHYVKNTTFDGLSFLRKLDLAENVIEKIEPFTFSKRELALLEIYLSHNMMRTVDVSNLAIEKPFCRIDASHNKIDTIVNEGGLHMNESLSYGEGGMVSLRNNTFSIFPDFTKLGVPDLTLIGKLMSFGFDFRGAKWNCNAQMVQFLQLAEDVINNTWRDYFDVKCYLPERLRGESIPQMVNDKRLNEFTSELTGAEGCPNSCKCTYYPVSNVSTVKCASSLLHMPLEMPGKGVLDIDFSETKIKRVIHASYIVRISRIRLHHTGLDNIPLNFIYGINGNLLSLIDLSYTANLDRLSTSFKILDPCNVHFGKKTIFCNCNNRWIQEWIDSSSCKWNSSLTCRTSKGLVPLPILSAALGCEEENYLYKTLSVVFSIITLLLAMSLGTIYLYRYEIQIVLKRHKDPYKINLERYKYDVYISVNKESDQLHTWILKILLPDLRRSGYRVHCPTIHTLPGNFVDEEVIEKMDQSRNFLIFLSEEYLNDLDTSDSIEGIRNHLEWRHAWNSYRNSKERRLIIINYGQNRLCEIRRKNLKAFLRVGKVLDFANKKHSLMIDLIELLGPPLRQFKGLGAGKPKRNMVKKKANASKEETELKHINVIFLK